MFLISVDIQGANTLTEFGMGRRLSKIFFSFYKDKFCPDLTCLLRYDILQQYVTYLLRCDILQQYVTYLPHVGTIGDFRVLFLCWFISLITTSSALNHLSANRLSRHFCWQLRSFHSVSTTGINANWNQALLLVVGECLTVCGIRNIPEVTTHRNFTRVGSFYQAFGRNFRILVPGLNLIWITVVITVTCLLCLFHPSRHT